MASHSDTSPSHAKRGESPTKSVPGGSAIGDNSASELIESPQPPERDPLDPHDFAEGGGGGGGEAFRRTGRPRRPP